MSIAWKDPAVVKALNALREKPDAAAVIEEMDSEYLVVSILVAHSLNVDKALVALRKTAEWRTSSGAKDYRKRILAEKLEPKDFPRMDVVGKYLPSCEGGKAVDKRGLSYTVVCLGMLDTKKIFEEISEADWLVLQFYISEYRLLKCEEYARREGVLGNISLVQDLTCQDGLLSLWKENRHNMGTLRKTADLTDLHYPGLIGTIFFMHAPWAFDALLSLILPLMPKRLSQKVMVLSTAKVTKLHEFISPDSLPRFLGGAVDDADFVPTRKNVKDKTGTELVVAARGKDERGLWLSKGDIVSYGFSINGGYDIMLSCRFESDGETTEIRPPFRVDADSGGNSFEAPGRGRLVLVFDNTYSWVNPKTLQYEFSVVAALTDTVPAADDKIAAAGGYEAAAVPEAAAPASS